MAKKEEMELSVVRQNLINILDKILQMEEFEKSKTFKFLSNHRDDVIKGIQKTTNLKLVVYLSGLAQSFFVDRSEEFDEDFCMYVKLLYHKGIRNKTENMMLSDFYDELKENISNIDDIAMEMTFCGMDENYLAANKNGHITSMSIEMVYKMGFLTGYETRCMQNEIDLKLDKEEQNNFISVEDALI